MKLPEHWRDPQLAAIWEQLQQVRQEVNKALEQARTGRVSGTESFKPIGASTEAKVILKVSDPSL
jgi:Isoleucyl-tRNA synthetase (EC 6.1.1.5)